MISPLGEGAAAVIYKVSNVHTGRVFAAKVLRQSVAKSEFVKDKFLAETHILQVLDHPNIVRVYDSYRSDEIAACIMQYVEGSTLEQYLPLHPGGLSEVLTYSLAVQVIDAMRYAHAQNIVHRDLKPSNILLQQESDGNLRAYVADFGLAKAISAEVKTQTGLRIGTMAYMAPEQIQDSSRVDHRADIYALGVSLYECLTGVLPFNFRSMVQVIQAQMGQPIPSVLHHRVDVSPRWDTIIAKACEKRREDRYDSASEMLRALRKLGDELGLTSRSTIAISPVRVGGDQAVDDLEARKTAQFVSVRDTAALGDRHTIEMQKAVLDEDLEHLPTHPLGVQRAERPEAIAEQLFLEETSESAPAKTFDDDLTLRGEDLPILHAELAQLASLSDIEDRTLTAEITALDESMESGEVEELHVQFTAPTEADDSVVVRASLLQEATSKKVLPEATPLAEVEVAESQSTPVEERGGRRTRALSLIKGGGPSGLQLVFLLALCVMGLAALCIGLYFALR